MMIFDQNLGGARKATADSPEGTSNRNSNTFLGPGREYCRR